MIIFSGSSVSHFHSIREHLYRIQDVESGKCFQNFRILVTYKIILKILPASFKLLSLAFVGIAFAQVYIPTGTSVQSGIIRNVPLVRWPGVNSSPAQVYRVRSNDESRDQYSSDDSLSRYITVDTENRLRNYLRTSSDPDWDLRRTLSNAYDDRDNQWNSVRSRNDNDERSRQRNTLNQDQLRALLSSGRYNNDDDNNDNDDSNGNDNNRNNNNNGNRNQQRGNDDSNRSNRSRNRNGSNQTNNQN